MPQHIRSIFLYFLNYSKICQLFNIGLKNVIIAPNIALKIKNLFIRYRIIAFTGRSITQILSLF
jgi:hypothetical protein